jgi:hypothetical protein
MDVETIPRSEIRRAKSVKQYYRYAPIVRDFPAPGKSEGAPGFFRFGDDVICYGQSSDHPVFPSVKGHLPDSLDHVRILDSSIILPFDIDQVADNLRYERYEGLFGWQKWVQASPLRDVYYRLRPLLSVSIRKHLQKVYLRDWRTIPFPNWPVDRSVDLLFERLIVLAMRFSGIARLPFIWFWPDGHNACAILTHDVETTAGRDFCSRVMDLDDAAGIKASFQIVPEKRYTVSAGYLQTIRNRGFEINVQGLDHDGNLFQSRREFLKSAEHINRYAAQYRARGFRSPILYRNIDWFQDLNFSYDLSVPNVARLEPQRGGCCTVMPFFLPGEVIELPLTTTEDYSIFNVLNEYSTALWKKQIQIILGGHGLMTFLIHPDYVISGKPQDVFKGLLEQVNQLRSDQKVWVTLPKEVDRWWRQRSEMALVPAGSEWEIRGSGSDRATLAYACLDGDNLSYEFA